MPNLEQVRFFVSYVAGLFPYRDFDLPGEGDYEEQDLDEEEDENENEDEDEEEEDEQIANAKAHIPVCSRQPTRRHTFTN
ncbi:MAG TPA: hypothetical protein VFD30_10485 [Terriglobia bacterium]|jgi:Ran GTPase-activating protein (RanGAP) involved in mRNA processing and transport|nr:hypothetical protein [Terriglobia bacterium]